MSVFGTGHLLPRDAQHIGSAVVPTFCVYDGAPATTLPRIESAAGLVWHVFAKYDPEAERQALAEQGRRLASTREDLIAQGVDPGELPIPLHPDPLPSAAPCSLPPSERTEHHLQQVHDEATSLAHWLANELGEHVDDQNEESLTDTVRRLIAIKLAPPDAPAVPITDWGDFHIGDVVVQNPAGPEGRDDDSDFLVRRPGATLAGDEPQIGGFQRGHIVTIGPNGGTFGGWRGVVATLDHDHGWRLWVRVGTDVHDMHAPALYLSPDDLDMVVVP